MYKVSGVSIKQYITDPRIRIPRFQRKKTWDEKKNFKLCISLFKDYPIGVSIVSVEKVGGREVKYLLDGRQRREALAQLNTDPENLYIWAQKFIKFRKNDSEEELKDKFDEVISAFLEEEESQQPQQQSQESAAEGEAQDGVDPSFFGEGDSPEGEESEGEGENEEVQTPLPVDGKDLLLRLILKTHHWTKKGSGFTAPFDFTKFVTQLTYSIKLDETNYKLSSRRLKNFISDYRDFCDANYSEDPDAYKNIENFIEYVKTNLNIISGKEAKLKDHIRRHWGAMLERIELLQKLDEKLSTNEIGVIEVNDMQSFDYQKIFNLINTQGADLKAVEILSAKPKWNYVITNPSADFEEQARKLYRVLGTSPERYVKWDMAATFISRLEEDNIFFKKYTDTPTDFEAKITAGFVLLSGIYEGAVNKEAFDKLGANTTIRWERDIDALITSIKNMSAVLGSYSYFQFFKTWKCNMQSLTSDYIAYNFFILCYKNWVRRGCPMGSGSATKDFQKECFFLFDKLIYEYVTGKWKGSGDSRIKNNIENLETNFTHIQKEDWTALLNNIFDNGIINDADIKFDLMKPILYHFYCLNQQAAPSMINPQFDVDHIIPQALFNSSTFPRKETLRDNLLNLGLLPKSENCSKGKKRLIEITDPWMQSIIKELEFIDVPDYLQFSNVNNYTAMFAQRRPLFEQAFTTKRDNLLNN